MKRIKRLFIAITLTVMSFLVLKTHIFADSRLKTITLTYVAQKDGENLPGFKPTFDHQDEVEFPVEITYEVKKHIDIFHIPNITAPHYSFNGWVYYEGNTEYILRKGDRFTENTTFYARWTPTPKFISYNLNGGVNNLGNPYIFNITTELELEKPYKTGFSFDGWYLDKTKRVTSFVGGKWLNKTANPEGEEVVPDDPYNINLTAAWKNNKYTITFDSLGGSSVASINEDFETDISAPTDPTKTGYTFAGWYKESSLTNLFTFDLMPADNIRLYAKWDANKYHVIFMKDNETESDRISQDFDKPITSLVNTVTDPTKIGYTFKYWYILGDDAKAYDFPENMPLGGLIVYAKWEANTYTVQFDENGGQGSMDNQTHTYDAELSLTKNTFTKEGYTFAGWNTQSDGKGTSYFDEASVKNLTNFPSGTVTLYAQWEGNVFSVEFLDYTNTRIIVNNINQGETITPLLETDERVKREGYTFNGWKINGSGAFIDFDTYTVQEDVVFKPIYEINQYAITFNSNGGSAVTKITQDYGSTVNAPANPTKTGYTFAGWYSNFELTTSYSFPNTIGASNITLYAKWNTESYTIIYHLNGGSHNGNPETYTIETATITLSNASKTGYDFDGWYDAESGGNEVTQIANGSTGNKNLYARWSPINYAITYYLDGGDNHENNPATYTIETATITLNDASKEGYTFKGWYDAASEGNQVTSIPKGSTGSKVLYARWEILKFTVIFKDHDGSVLDTQSDVPWNTAATAPGNPSRTGHTFSIWTPAFTNVKSNLTVTAQYSVNTYTVSFNSNGGSEVNSITKEYDTAITKPDDPTKTGYTFAGWYKESGLMNAWNFTSDKIPADNITLFAKWNTVSYTISYNLDGGSHSGNPATYNVESNDITLSEATRDGYDFVGWYNSASGGSKITKITKGSTGNKTLYARWTGKTYTITFNINVLNKTTLLWDFVGDYKEFYGRTGATQQELYDNFAGKSYIAAPYDIKDIFQPEYKNGRWVWLKDYILYYAQQTNYAELDQLEAWNQTTWRTNIEAIIKQKQFNFAGASNSMDFKNNKFTKTYQTGTTTSITTVTALEGWYDNSSLNGNQVTQIKTTDYGDKTLYTKLWKVGYGSKNAMINAFLDDFYNYLGLTSSVSNFKHGSGKTSGFDGEWHSVYKDRIYSGPKPTAVDNNYFASSARFMNKWLPFFDMMDRFVKEVNNEQFFWGAGTSTGLIRIRQYIINVKPANYVSDETMAMMPSWP